MILDLSLGKLKKVASSDIYNNIKNLRGYFSCSSKIEKPMVARVT